MAIYSAQVTITDPTSPSVGTMSGELARTTGYHRGTEAATFSASDQTGIKSLRLFVDGVAMPATDRACDFTFTLPCENPDGPASASLDTTTLSDGPHSIQAAAMDAADNETRSPSATITVDNSPPAAPHALVASGSGRWQRGPTVSLSWTNPGGQVAPIEAARLTWCRLDGSGCTTTIAPVSGASPGLPAAMPGEGAYSLGVSLIDAAGNVGSSQATTTVLHDATAPAAPDGLAIADRAPTDGTVAASWRRPAGQQSPVREASLRLCPAGGTANCTAPQTSSAESVTLAIPSTGDWELRVSLTDEAGNTGPEAVSAFRYVARPAPEGSVMPVPVATPQPTAPPGPSPVATPTPQPPVRPRVTPSVRTTSAKLTSTRLSLRGTLPRSADGLVRITYSATVGGRTRRMTRSIRPRSGRFGITLGLPRSLRGARRGTIELRYGGDSTYAPRTVRRTVRRP